MGDLLLILLASAIGAQPVADTVSGRVLDTDRAPVIAAEVTVTAAGSTDSRSTRTDSAGRFAIEVVPAAQYIVFVRARDGTSARVSVQRAAGGHTMIEVTITAVRVLPPVRVTTRRIPVARLLEPEFGVGEESIDFGSSYPGFTDQADVLATLNELPGILLGADGDGFSVLGLSNAHNLITFNGASVQSLTLPKLTPVLARVTTSSYDVSRGGFSGAHLRVEPQQGINYVINNVALSLRHPALVAGDRAVYPDERNLQADFSRSGPVVWDRAFYSVSGHLGQTTRPVTSLLTAAPAALATIGISPSAVIDLVDAMESSAIPQGPLTDADNVRTNSSALFGRLELADDKPRRLSITGTGSLRRSANQGIGLTSAPTQRMRATSAAWSVQLAHEQHIRKALLNESKFAHSRNYASGRPLVNLPTAVVLLESEEGEGPVVPVFIGGPTTGNRKEEQRSLDFSNSTSWYSLDQRHSLKLSVEARAERIYSTRTGTAFGEYAFPSTADLLATRPSTYFRDLTPSISRARFATLALSLGDRWQPRSNLEFMGGLRLDALRPAPVFSDDALAAADRLGIRAEAPAWRAGLSPRLGFVRTITRPATRPNQATRRWIISGGSGVFRATGARAILDPLTRAGWSSTPNLQLRCVGDAVPDPDWSAFALSPAAIPNACASPTEAAGDSSLAVAVVQSGFRSPYSWRTNFGVSSRLGRFPVGIEGIVSLNLNQPSFRDANHLGVERFRLEGEGMRPVFVPPAAISSTGALTSAANRREPGIGTAWIATSDLQSLSRQLIIRFGPPGWSPLARGSFQASYTLSVVTEERRGFESSTAGDPGAIERTAAQLQTRHQFIVRSSRLFGSTDAVELSGYVRISSGFRFTPLVASDINGDGLINDRAWVFDPAQVTDATFADALAGVMNHGSAHGRRCLERQVGRMAGAQSCSGPWNVLSAMNVTVRGDAVRLPERSRLTLQFSNPLGVVDRLIHGQAMRGWGGVALSDPYLLTVRGFDPVERSFEYSVNPHFGSSRSARTLTSTPTRITVAFVVPLGPTHGAQMLETELATGRWRAGERVNADVLTHRLAEELIGGALARLGTGRDSVNYTPMQRSIIRAAVAERDSAVVAAFRVPAEYAEALGDRPTTAERRELVRLSRVSTDSAEAAFIRAAETIRPVLTTDQLERLPSSTAAYLSPAEIRRLRRAGMFVF